MEILRKPNMTKTKALTWSKSNEEAVELRSVTPVMAANTQRLFLWDRPANGFAKSRKDRNEPPGKRRDPELPEAGVKGKAFPFGRVKRRQSLIRVPGGNVRRRSRARPRPVKCWEPTLSTGYYLPT